MDGGRGDTTPAEDSIMRRLPDALAVAGLVVTLASCAKIEPPPGGPPDTSPPQLIGWSPDSQASLPGFNGEVEFRFNEVISEGSTANTGTGTGDLERLILLSPTTRVPDVQWKRTRITVRPREGWRPDRTYRIELLPGLMDLRNNRATSMRKVITFTTGGPAPTDTLRGQLTDWTTGSPASRGLVEALLLPDSLPYRVMTDSAGRFEAAPLPAGTGVLDQNGNGRREEREPFDSVVTTGDSTLALFAFPHDTNPPRLRDATAQDSVTVALEFTQPLAPGQALDTSRVTVRHLPDSAVVPVADLVTPRALDSLRRAALPTDTLGTPSRDSMQVPSRSAPAGIPAQRDTTPGRPPLSTRLMLVMASRLDTAGQYLVMVRGIRNVTGVTGDVRAVFAAQKPFARLPQAGDSLPGDSLPVSTDSLGTAADSLRSTVDSVKSTVDGQRSTTDSLQGISKPKSP
jgi:hypothetical protein